MPLRALLVVLLLALAAVTVTPSAAAEECTPEQSKVQLCMGERECYPDPCMYTRYCVVWGTDPVACVWWPF